MKNFFFINKTTNLLLKFLYTPLLLSPLLYSVVMVPMITNINTSRDTVLTTSPVLPNLRGRPTGSEGFLSPIVPVDRNLSQTF